MCKTFYAIKPHIHVFKLVLNGRYTTFKTVKALLHCFAEISDAV